MSVCLIGLGSNLGDRRRTLDEAVGQLARHPAVGVIAQSPWLETPPVGGPADQSPYLNGAVALEDVASARGALGTFAPDRGRLGPAAARALGTAADRSRSVVVRPGRAPDAVRLVLPHPRMTWRRFVLEPAALVGGDMVHPLTGWTVRRHLDHLNSSAFYMAITGPMPAKRTELARQVALRSGAQAILAAPTSRRPQAFSEDPAGHARPLALEFLPSWSALLAPDWPGWSAAAGVVSDFWFDEAILWLPRPQREEHRALWEQARAAVVRPRLIVFLEETSGDARQFAGRTRTAGAGHAARPGTAVAAVRRRSGRGLVPRCWPPWKR